MGFGSDWTFEVGAPERGWRDPRPPFLDHLSVSGGAQTPMVPDTGPDRVRVRTSEYRAESKEGHRHRHRRRGARRGPLSVVQDRGRQGPPSVSVGPRRGVPPGFGQEGWGGATDSGGLDGLPSPDLESSPFTPLHFGPGRYTPGRSPWKHSWRRVSSTPPPRPDVSVSRAGDEPTAHRTWVGRARRRQNRTGT